MLLHKYISEYEKNKISIIKEWISHKKVIDILNSYKIEKELFLKRYAFGFLDYHIELIKAHNKIENSSLILDFLKYLKKYDIKLNELYIIYNSFSNSFSNFIFTLESPSKELIEEIDELCEQVFSNILEDYTKNLRQFKEALSKSTNIVDNNVILSRIDSQGKIIKLSTAFCKISAYESSELLGKHYSILKYDELSNKIYEDLKNTIEKGKIWRGELKNRKKDGNYFWVETSIYPNFDEFNNITHYDIISQDITSKKDLESQQDILIEQSKSAAMGEMISMIAHQWRQPLQAVSILVQKIAITQDFDGEIDSEFIDKVVDDIMSQLDYMSKTIDDFRDYFKPNKEQQNIFIKDIVISAVDFLDYMFKAEKIDLQIDIQDNDKVNVFLSELIQVFINIFKNSKDAMDEKNIKNRKIFIRTFSEKNYINIEIEDNAGGIDENIIHKIFEPYFSTKSNKNGTGLGLYMSKNIIEKHCNGKLFAQNTNNGAKFLISLPKK
ncbi:MAG: PAS domain S-box protein [Arcobacter sp.]|nr:PAS domain S-box protein [Arcobacter sp.]